MAWLYKHPRSQFWQIGWRVGNELFNLSTKVTNKADAEKKLALFDLMAMPSPRAAAARRRPQTGRHIGR
jgi:G:T/U-mismatch repair DNA glycosylase